MVKMKKPNTHLNTPKLYAAYGSNLDTLQMGFRCPGAKLFGSASLPSSALVFRGSKTGSYLTVEPQWRSTVPLGIWEVRPEDEAALDRYEGFPSFYIKKTVTLPVREAATGKTHRRKVFYYVMRDGRPAGRPTRGYFQTCLRGYHDFGFDRAYLGRALKRTVREMEMGD